MSAAADQSLASSRAGARETYIDTRVGWREVSEQTFWGKHDVEIIATYPPKGSGEPQRFFARVPPVPPLPIEPYTVIRVTWRRPQPLLGAAEVLMRNRAGFWQIEDITISPTDLAKDITGFEVLAEPRAVTAKAVLEQVEARGSAGSWHTTLIAVVNEIEAQS